MYRSLYDLRKIRGKKCIPEQIPFRLIFRPININQISRHLKGIERNPQWQQKRHFFPHKRSLKEKEDRKIDHQRNRHNPFFPSDQPLLLTFPLVSVCNLLEITLNLFIKPPELSGRKKVLTIVKTIKNIHFQPPAR